MLRMSWKTQALVLMIVFLHGSSIAESDEQRGEREQVEQVLEQVGKLRETMTVPENSHAQEGMEAARSTAEQFNSPGFQEQLRCQMERIQNGNSKQEQPSATQGKGTLSGQETVYLFLSSSVPETVVNRYLIDIGRTGEQRIVPVLFGLPEGMEGKRINVD